MKASKVAVALAIALATNAAVAADRDNTRASESGHKWYEAGERQLQSQEQLQKLEREGFPQYSN